MPPNHNQSNRPNTSAVQRPSNQQRPQAMPPNRSNSMPIRPPQQPQRPPQPQLPRPQPSPQRPRPHNPRWPSGLTPHMPVMPRPPSVSFMPRGFPIRLQAQIGLIVAPITGAILRRRPSRFSQAVGSIANHTFVWVFGQSNGWSLVHFNGQFGFVNSRFVII